MTIYRSTECQSLAKMTRNRFRAETQKISADVQVFERPVLAAVRFSQQFATSTIDCARVCATVCRTFQATHLDGSANSETHCQSCDDDPNEE